MSEVDASNRSIVEFYEEVEDSTSRSYSQPAPAASCDVDSDLTDSFLGTEESAPRSSPRPHPRFTSVKLKNKAK